MQTKKKQTIKMPTGDIDKDIEIIEKVALKTLKEVGKIDPTLYVINKDYAHIISGAGLPETSDERRNLFGQIGTDIGKKMPDAYAFIMVMEAWSSTQKVGDGYTQPSKDPKATETLILSAMNSKGDSRFIFKPFTKEKDGKIKIKPLAGGLKDMNKEGWLKRGDEGEIKVHDNMMFELWSKYKMSSILRNLG